MTATTKHVRMAMRRVLPGSVVRAFLLATYSGFAAAQSVPVSASQSPADQSSAPQAVQPVTVVGNAAARPSERDRRRAARFYLDASKLFMAEKFEDAQKNYEAAAQIDPTNPDYRLAGQVARNHAVTALVQSAAKDRLVGDAEGARAALTRALKLDPNSVEVTQHFYELGDDAASQRSVSAFTSEQPTPELSDAVTLEASKEKHSFHIRSNQRELAGEVFKAYGIDAMMDESVRSAPARLDIDDAGFDDAVHAVSMVTHTFYVPLDAHRVVVAVDTAAKRQEFTRLLLETVYLPGLKDEEMTEVSTLAKQVFNIKQADIDHRAGAITVRAPKATLEVFNSTLRTLIDGHSQVVLDVKLFQIAHRSGRNLGVQPPQSFAAYNVYAEEQSILNQNADLVQQIISSGLAAPGDTLAILGILLASGQVSNPIFSNGLALFGGGITSSALSPSPANAYFNITSSDSRELDALQLRLGDGETGTLKLGQRYPIQTSSFSSLSSSVANIPGLTTAGNSGSLSSILASLQGAVPNIPQVQYQDLGLTLKSTANVMRDDRVALTLDLQVTALSGGSINGNPILNNRSYSGVVTIKEGTAVVVVSDLDKSESRAISGTPGLSEIPGMNNVTEKDTQKSFATLLVVITPHVVRYTQPNGRTPMLRIGRASQAQ
jgi:general secretion pathway protein D